MPEYVDGFVLCVPKKNMAAYKKMAAFGAKIWKKHGAIDYRECVGEDMKVKFGVPFPKMMKPKTGETVVFSYITYKSRKHRDSVNAKVMKDPALCAFMDPSKMPFDCKRMVYGGFETLVGMP
jgi:uncharacterized protein YbaA (DUF1428 family)